MTINYRTRYPNSFFVNHTAEQNHLHTFPSIQHLSSNTSKHFVPAKNNDAPISGSVAFMWWRRTDSNRRVEQQKLRVLQA